MPSPDQCRIYGYARVSTGEQVPSVKRQIADIEAKARELPGTYAGCRQEIESAAKIRFDDRKVLGRLMEKLERGDHLIVWRLDRIDRNLFGMIRAMEFLMNRDVYVHSLEEFGGHKLDLDTASGRAMLVILGIAADMFIEQLRAATKRGLLWCKQNGLVCRGTASLGKKWVRDPAGRRTRKDKPARIEVWDEEECIQIREIKRRHDAGETICEIGLDFFLRKERTANGKLWVKPYGQKKRLNYARLYKAYHDYTALLAGGKDIGGTAAITVPGALDPHAPLPATHKAKRTGASPSR